MFGLVLFCCSLSSVRNRVQGRVQGAHGLAGRQAHGAPGEGQRGLSTARLGAEQVLLARAQCQVQVRLCSLIEPNKGGSAAANDVASTLRGTP